jgi:hypothetical protein
LQWARHYNKRVLTYYVGIAETWPDKKLLFTSSDEENSRTLNPQRGPYDWIMGGGLSAELQHYWFREPTSVRELLHWITFDITETAWSLTFAGRLFWCILRPFGCVPPGQYSAHRPGLIRRQLAILFNAIMCPLFGRPRVPMTHLFRICPTFGFRQTD